MLSFILMLIILTFCVEDLKKNVIPLHQNFLPLYFSQLFVFPLMSTGTCFFTPIVRIIVVLCPGKSFPIPCLLHAPEKPVSLPLASLFFCCFQCRGCFFPLIQFPLCGVNWYLYMISYPAFPEDCLVPRGDFVLCNVLLFFFSLCLFSHFYIAFSGSV